MLFGLSGGLVAPACVGAVFALLGVFVVLVRSLSFARFGLGFGLVVRGGRWVCVSCRSGRVLSGGAVRACRAALVRRGLLSSASLVGASAFPAVPVGSPVVSSVRPAFVRRVVSSVRRSFLPAVWSPVLPAGGWCPPSSRPSSWSGSVLLLSSPAFVSAVRGGACPVSLALGSFPRWCLRSGLLGALCLAGRAGALRAGVARVGLAPVLRSFLSVALPSLGLSASLPSSVLWRGLSSFWSGGAVPPRPSWSGASWVRWELFGLRSAFSALSGSLGWLRRRGGACPPACRPLLACLCAWVLRALG